MFWLPFEQKRSRVYPPCPTPPRPAPHTRCECVYVHVYADSVFLRDAAWLIGWRHQRESQSGFFLGGDEENPVNKDGGKNNSPLGKMSFI